MKRIIYTEGQILGNNITFMEEAGMQGTSRMGKFKCHCGNIFNAAIHTIKRKHTKSCGCGENKGNFRHGVQKSNRRLYSVYINMKKRCYSATSKDYKYYGAKGIKVCDEWLNDIVAFYDWSINNGYKNDLTIDRLDNSKSYSPDNCTWSTILEQQHNKSNTYLNKDIVLFIRESKLSRKKLAKKFNVSVSNISSVQQYKSWKTIIN